LEGFDIVGKTGTSQVVDAKNGRYAPGKYIGTYIGYARNLPIPLVIYTMIEEPKGIYYGGSTAAPLFRSIFEVAVARFSLSRQLAEKKMPKAPVDSLKDSLKLQMAKPVHPEERNMQWVDRDEEGNANWKLPALEGMTLREALRVLTGKDFVVEVRGEGSTVKKQYPIAGTVVPEKTAIRLHLGDEE
jgi:membrane carboxypeptidase/penicillin-binding protein